MSFLEDYRSGCVNSVFAMKGFANCWPTWRSEIDLLTKNLTDADAIYDLGSKLKSVFKLTATSGRSQGSLSGGGAAWEGFVCWYLNLILTDTRAVVTKKSKNLSPLPILDAISVNYNNIATNSESDLLGIVFPEDDLLDKSLYSKRALDDFCGNNIGKIYVHNMQCKTNWNDNAQIPMLWDMIYRAKGFKGSGVSVGRDGRSLGDLAGFTYSFITIPSQNKAFSPKGMPVTRVSGLSGGNFWGQPAHSGVAWSISDVFKRVFGDNVIGDVRQHISRLVQNGQIKLR